MRGIRGGLCRLPLAAFPWSLGAPCPTGRVKPEKIQRDP